MTSFILTFRAATGHEGSEAEHAQWMQWFGQIGASIVEMGAQTGATSSLGNAPDGSRISGYTIVQAADLEAAVLLAKGCPALGNGGGVEVGELLEMG